EATTELLQIAREATSNVARHSGARTVELRLEYAPGLLTLVIRDNGRGLDAHLELRGRGHAGARGAAVEGSRPGVASRPTGACIDRGRPPGGAAGTHAHAPGGVRPGGCGRSWLREGGGGSGA